MKPLRSRRILRSDDVRRKPLHERYGVDLAKLEAMEEYAERRYPEIEEDIRREHEMGYTPSEILKGLEYRDMDLPYGYSQTLLVDEWLHRFAREDDVRGTLMARQFAGPSCLEAMREELGSGTNAMRAPVRTSGRGSASVRGAADGRRHGQGPQQAEHLGYQVPGVRHVEPLGARRHRVRRR